MPFDLSLLRHDYGDAIAEAKACRTTAALFDFSFVARGRVTGPGAISALQSITSRPLHSLQPGQIAYAVREGSDGRLLADLTVWRLDGDDYELMSGRSEDVRDLVEASSDGRAADLSDETAIFALQGPGSLNCLRCLDAPVSLANLAYFHHTATEICGVDCRVGRLGYTGEAGFEIVAPKEHAATLWAEMQKLARPAGFASANILRIEAGFVLFANEFRIPVSAQEVGLERFASEHSPGLGDDIRLVTFRSSRIGTPALWAPAAQLARPAQQGELVATSACTSPLCEGTLGLGYVRRVDLDRRQDVFNSDAFGEVEIGPRPFYDTSKQRPRQPWSGSQ